jgi:hypothetical protein
MVMVFNQMEMRTGCRDVLPLVMKRTVLTDRTVIKVSGYKSLLLQEPNIHGVVHLKSEATINIILTFLQGH